MNVPSFPCQKVLCKARAAIIHWLHRQSWPIANVSLICARDSDTKDTKATNKTKENELICLVRIYLL